MNSLHWSDKALKTMPIFRRTDESWRRLSPNRSARVHINAFHACLWKSFLCRYQICLAPQSATPSSFSVNPDRTRNVSTAADFIDRRNSVGADNSQTERRQFGSSHMGLSEDGRELALAIDQFKVQHHRRYLTCDEMLKVLTSLGYSK